MKVNRRTWILLWLLLVATAFQLPAQQTEADRKLVEEVKAKAEKGNAEAQHRIGDFYTFGQHGVNKDDVEGVKWYRKAAGQGLATAQYNLAICYDNGRGVPQDYVEAVKWYRKAADQGDAQAQCNLGGCYAFGQGVPQDYAEAVKWFRKAADQGLAKAQYNLGVCYDKGRGLPQDYAEAVKWYRKAADQGNANAQYNLGVCCDNGRGLPQDYVEAVKWFRKAADQGDAQAQFSFGGCYVLGQGVPQDYAEAVKWFRKAAEKGDAGAQRNLGLCYAQGQGVPQDYAEAVKWFRKAADQGRADAQFNFGWCYDQGQGVPQSYTEAAKWFRKAAEQGYAKAQLRLGGCYDDGMGVAKDYVQAYTWYNLAAAQGGEEARIARQLLNLLENEMKPNQIAEAQRLAREFKPHKIPSDGRGSSSADFAQTRPESSGTGFFISVDGFLVTNEHVVRDAAQVRLVTSAGLISAKVVKVDAANDLALLKAEGPFAALPVAASRGVKLGGTVATVGFPNIGLQGFAPKLAKGEIASLSGAGDDARYFQISVPVQPGNSGGALVDERGNVVGVVSAKLNALAALAASGTLPENVNYAVKSGYLLTFLESVPDVAAKLKDPNTKERKFEDVVKDAEQAAVLVLVY